MTTDVIPHSPSPSSLGPGATGPLNSAGHPGTVSGEHMATLPVMINAPPAEENYKNRLQEFAQKSAMPLPVYNTTNHGLSHAPRFKSTVVVDGLVFVSPKAFTRAKAAEQDVAKYALEALTQKIQEEGCSMLNLVPTLYKAILNEFAVKISVPMPTYVTRHADGMIPAFISDALFCGRTYTSRGNSKKEAEQMVARVVIETILGNSCSRLVMSHIVNSKIKLCDPLRENPVISATEDQPESDPLGEFVHKLPGILSKKKRNKEKKEESQSKKQRLEEQQEPQDSHLKKQHEQVIGPTSA